MGQWGRHGAVALSLQAVGTNGRDRFTVGCRGSLLPNAVVDMSPIDPLLVVMLIACFAGAATLAVAEVSILRVRRSEVLLDADQQRTRARELLRLLDELPVVLNCVLLLILLLQVSAATIASSLAVRWFGGIGATIAAFVMTMVLFLLISAHPTRGLYRRGTRNASGCQRQRSR